MNTDQVIYDRYKVPASTKDCMTPDVEALVKQGEGMILLRIPKQDWEHIEVEMSIGCARAIVDVLSVAVTTAKANHAEKIERMKEEK